MKKDLPVFELRINPETNALVDAIALVDEPAIESDFIAFSKIKDDVVSEFFSKNQSANDDKRELIGAAMIPDMKIYRKDAKSGEEYNVFFSKETIREIAQNFFKNGFQSKINLDHTSTPAKSFVFQSYIVDSSKGISAPKGLDVPDGTWVIGLKVEDENVWKDIKEGNKKGFSIEGLFEFFNKKTEDELILETVQSLHKHVTKSNNKMSNIKDAIQKFANAILSHYSDEVPTETTETVEQVEETTEEKFEDAPVDAPAKVWTEDELKLSDRTVGASVELINADGSLSPAPDGDYELDGGFKFTVKDGVISSIEGEQPQEEPAPEDQSKFEAMQNEISELKSQLEQMKEAFENQKQEATNQVEMFTNAMNELSENIKILAKTPVEFSKTTQNPKVKEDKEAKMFAVAKILANSVHKKN